MDECKETYLNYPHTQAQSTQRQDQHGTAMVPTPMGEISSSLTEEETKDYKNSPRSKGSCHSPFLEETQKL